MPYDRFLIAPMNTGLQTDLKPYHLNTSFGIIKNILKGCIMRLRTPRVDIKELKGKRFGDLTVIDIAKSGKYRGIVWNCLCDCGNLCQAYGGHLRDGTRKSCGCRSQSRIFDTGINRLYSSYKSLASRRKKIFLLTREKLQSIVLMNCHYCGREPHNELKRLKTKKTLLKYNGIDRFDPNRGYENDNCVPCCYYCNHSKLDLTFDKWIEHVKKIIAYSGKSNAL